MLPVPLPPERYIEDLVFLLVARLGKQQTREPYMRKCDDQVICIAQFESRAAVEQADAIMAVDGIDIAIVGRGDLAHDIGLPGKASSDEVTALVDRVIAAARRNNKVAGILVATPEEGRTWADKGMRFLTYGNEIKFLMATYAKGLEIIRGGK
ncbi:hypothetical protein KL86DPRO_40091 [uncultured delta proteobacterium]|uniref:HpcH/HpaI aldolase/citrate lyase domain-containing protein n=1 Tax=uncultured delta proteobacterium TaxID=34034 RepID=A0A212K9L6_9DELT|nr:hypothetical protein KL86DPRO_40091 [uncultured delta proteobacterium]